MILCSAEPRIISCLPTHVINLVINDNSLEILYIYIYPVLHTDWKAFSILVFLTIKGGGRCKTFVNYNIIS